MPTVGPNLAETPRCSRIRKICETILYILLLCVVYPITPNREDYLFQKYLQDFNKSYENITVYQQRFKAFKESLKNIERLNLNRTNGSAIYGLTKYSDMFPEDFSKSQLILKLPYKKTDIYEERILSKRASPKNYKIPKKVDFREKNLVSKVQEQGRCGACWAFSVIGVIETMNAIKTGNLTRLSVQEMIDCSMYDYGCKGGDVCSLLNWLYTFNVNILPEDIYPLSLATGVCKDTTKYNSTHVQVKDFGCNSFVGNEEMMLYLLANFGPLAVGINAQSWQHYVGGTIKYHCNSSSTALNHAVQIVGYDLTADIPFYIVKNSWGTDFGDAGYLYIEIGENLCGLAHEVAYVQIL